MTMKKGLECPECGSHWVRSRVRDANIVCLRCGYDGPRNKLCRDPEGIGLEGR